MADYNIDNAKNDIQNLQDQNSYDFQEIKRLDGLIKDYDKRILQAINLNNQINKKIQDDYEKFKKSVIDDNLVLGNGESIRIVDNLNSTSTTSALSANQGSVIKSSLNDINTRIDNLNLGNGESIRIVDNLNSTSTTSALSANQGSVIKSSLNDINTRVDDINTRIDNLNLGNGGGNTESEGSSTGNFDTEISLPFTAPTTTDVQLTFTPGVIESFNTVTPTNINEVTSWSVTGLSNGEYAFESTTFEGKKCVHFKNIKGGTSYSTVTSKGDTLLNQQHKYFQICDIYLVSDGDNTGYPKIYGANTVTDATIPVGEWKRFKGITTPTNSTNKANFRFMIDGEAYFTCCLVDLTENNMETKTLEELEQMYNEGKFGVVVGGEFSCIINVNGEQREIEPFTSDTITEVVKVNGGSTVSITKNGNYFLPNFTAMVKSSNSNIQLDDVDIVINSRFRGKKAVFEGDSITDFDYHSAYEGKSWASYVANKLKLGSVLNPAKGGASLSTFNATNSVVTRITTTNYESDVKLFVVFAGTNDWGEGVALGDVDSTDITTVCGALNTIIDAIQTKCPEAEIVIISPMHRYADRTANNKAEYKLGDIAPKYKEICDKWGVHFFNGFNVGINAYNEANRSLYYIETSAWLHPSKRGHKRMACNIAGYIATL